VFGPRDYRITPATRALIGLAQGDPAFFHVCITDVRDVARAHVIAATRGKSGGRYIVTGEQLAPAQVSAAVAKVTGARPGLMKPPRWLLSIISRLQVSKARRRGTDAPITPEQVNDIYGRHLAYDSTRSRTELGMSYRAAA